MPAPRNHLELFSLLDKANSGEGDRFPAQPSFDEPAQGELEKAMTEILSTHTRTHPISLKDGVHELQGYSGSVATYIRIYGAKSIFWAGLSMVGHETKVSPDLSMRPEDRLLNWSKK